MTLDAEPDGDGLPEPPEAASTVDREILPPPLSASDALGTLDGPRGVRKC
jgi:hypothetical protein